MTSSRRGAWPSAAATCSPSSGTGPGWPEGCGCAARFEESLRLLATSGDVSAVVLHLAAFARLAALDDDVEREVRLVGALRRLRDLTGTDLVTAPLNQLPTLPATLERLGADGERLLAEGAAMSEAEVVRYALHETPGSDLSG